MLKEPWRLVPVAYFLSDHIPYISALEERTILIVRNNIGDLLFERVRAFL